MALDFDQLDNSGNTNRKENQQTGTRNERTRGAFLLTKSRHSNDNNETLFYTSTTPHSYKRERKTHRIRL